MHTYKIIYCQCTCGNKNKVYTGYTVHNRSGFCNICGDWVYKQGINPKLLDYISGKSERYFEKFAIAWG